MERLLRQFDLPLTLLRPAFLMENIDEYALRRDDDGGLVLRLPLNERAVVHWIAVDDVGALVRLAFDRPGAFGRGPVHLGADELSFAEAAATIGEVLGEEVRYEQIALGEVKDRHARGCTAGSRATRATSRTWRAAAPPPRPPDVPPVARGRAPRPGKIEHGNGRRRLTRAARRR